MKLIDAAKWNAFVAKNAPTKDDPGYSIAVLFYAVGWADTLEHAMRVRHTERLADLSRELISAMEPKGHGISGFQYGAAVATLRDHWQHGRELVDLVVPPPVTFTMKSKRTEAQVTLEQGIARAKRKSKGGR